MRYLITTLILLIGFQSSSQTTGIKGQISSAGEPVPFANIIIDAKNLGTYFNKSGKFQLFNIPESKHYITISAVGFNSTKREITVVKESWNSILIWKP